MTDTRSDKIDDSENWIPDLDYLDAIDEHSFEELKQIEKVKEKAYGKF